MMWKVLPDILPKGDVNKKYQDMRFFVDEDNTRNLYQICYDEIEDEYSPFLISGLPCCQYEDNRKFEYIVSFLKRNHVNFRFDTNNKNTIEIFDPCILDTTIVEAPLYIEKDGVYYKKGMHNQEMPSEYMYNVAREYALKWGDKINVEEAKFDISHLSLDGGKSAFLEDYPSFKLNHISKNKYLCIYLPNNPNPYDIPYNEYSYNCRIVSCEANCFTRGQNVVVFDREIIAKHLVNGETCVVLPKEVASMVIGKAGENMKSLLYNLGVNRLNINADFKKAI